MRRNIFVSIILSIISIVVFTGCATTSQKGISPVNSLAMKDETRQIGIAVNPEFPDHYKVSV